MTGPARLAWSSLLAAALLAPATPAGAQTRPPYSLTLYDRLDYRGASATFYGDNPSVGSTGFAERALSAQVRGTWRLCEGGGYRNRCETLDADVRDLSTLGLAGRVGSVRLVAEAALRPTDSDPAYPPPPYALPPDRPPPSAHLRPEDSPRAYARPDRPRLEDPPPAADAPPYAWPAPAAVDAPPPIPGPSEGRTAVFISRPTLGGRQVSAAGAVDDADALCRALGFGRAAYFDDDVRAPRSVDVHGRPVGEGPVLGDLLCRRY